MKFQKTFQTVLTVFAVLFAGVCYGQDETKPAEEQDVDSVESKMKESDEFDQYRAFAASTKMIYIPGGTYKGKKIEPFYIDQDLVSVGQYKAAVRMGVCPQPPKTKDFSDSWKMGNNMRAQNNVNWYAANSFLTWVGKRLPTEDEWEWVARGREKAFQYPWGNRLPKKEDACWMRYFPEKDICLGPGVVGKDRATSRDGVHDMAGCLWQWTSTPYDKAGKLYVLKGGAWYNDNPEKLKVSSRGFANKYHNAFCSDGFRGVMSVEDYKKHQEFLKRSLPKKDLDLSLGRFAEGNKNPKESSAK